MKQAFKEWAKALVPAPWLTQWQVRRTLRRSPEAEMRLLPALCRAGTFVDVGANLGHWSGWAARMFAQVHAFEPLPALAIALRRAAPPHVTVHELALSDREGVGRFAVPIYRGRPWMTRASLERDANSGFDDETVVYVRVAPLDQLQLRDVDVIKIDVEGHEAAVLAGARQTLQRERPTLIVEIEERHHPGGSEPVIEALQARGYMCCYLRGRRIETYRPGSMAELQPVQARPLPGREPPAAGYVNNFFFVPVERAYEVEAMERLLGVSPSPAEPEASAA